MNIREYNLSIRFPLKQCHLRYLWSTLWSMRIWRYIQYLSLEPDLVMLVFFQNPCCFYSYLVHWEFLYIIYVTTCPTWSQLSIVRVDLFHKFTFWIFIAVTVGDYYTEVSRPPSVLSCYIQLWHCETCMLTLPTDGGSPEGHRQTRRVGVEKKRNGVPTRFGNITQNISRIQ